jgi:hypothetical protein
MAAIDGIAARIRRPEVDQVDQQVVEREEQKADRCEQRQLGRGFGKGELQAHRARLDNDHDMTMRMMDSTRSTRPQRL